MPRRLTNHRHTDGKIYSSYPLVDDSADYERISKTQEPSYFSESPKRNLVPINFQGRIPLEYTRERYRLVRQNSGRSRPEGNV